MVVPPLLVHNGLALPEHWKLYLPVVLASFVLMIPAVLYADRRGRAKAVLVASVVLLAATALGLLSSALAWQFTLAMGRETTPATPP